MEISFSSIDCITESLFVGLERCLDMKTNRPAYITTIALTGNWGVCSAKLTVPLLIYLAIVSSEAESFDSHWNASGHSCISTIRTFPQINSFPFIPHAICAFTKIKFRIKQYQNLTSSNTIVCFTGKQCQIYETK